MKTTGRLETMARRGTAALLTLTLLAMLLGSLPQIARAQEGPTKESGRLVVTVIDESSAVRGGACALVVDAAGIEQTVCDDDGDGTLVADGLAAGVAAVKPVQAAAGCAGAFGGEIEVPAGGEAVLTLTDACESSASTEETKPTEEPRPTEEEQKTEEATPTEDANETEAPRETEPPVETPTTEPTDVPTETPPATSRTPTPAAGPTRTGTLLIALSSTAFGRPSLGACYEVNEQPSQRPLAAVCDADNGKQDGLTTVAGLPQGEIVVVQVAGDPNDNPAAPQVTKIRAGTTTSLALATQALSAIDVVPRDADGQLWTAGVCFELRRHAAAGPVAVACVGADGVARFPNMPQGGWVLAEWRLPTDHDLAPEQFLYVDPGVSQVITVPHQRYRGSMTLLLVGEAWVLESGGVVDEFVFGGCVEYAPLSVEPFTTALVARCDGDDGSLDGRVVLTDLPADEYYVSGYDGYGPTVYNDRVYIAGGCDNDAPLEIRRDLPNPTVHCLFYRLHATLTITAVAAGTGHVLSGACYEVTRLASNGARFPVASVCDASGSANLELDQQGVYVITVTQAPNGYRPPTEQSVDVVMQVPSSGWTYYSVTFRLSPRSFSLP